jgi:hypothetical protein
LQACLMWAAATWGSLLTTDVPHSCASTCVRCPPLLLIGAGAGSEPGHSVLSGVVCLCIPLHGVELVGGGPAHNRAYCRSVFDDLKRQPVLCAYTSMAAFALYRNGQSLAKVLFKARLINIPIHSVLSCLWLQGCLRVHLQPHPSLRHPHGLHQQVLHMLVFTAWCSLSVLIESTLKQWKQCVAVS